LLLRIPVKSETLIYLSLRIGIMRLSRNEIDALLHITGSKAAQGPHDLFNALNVQRGSVSRIITRLKEKGLVDREDDRLVLAKAPPAESFKRLYYAHRASPFQLLLADRRIDLISRLGEEPKSVKELQRETGIPLKTVYYYFQDFSRLGVVIETNGRKGRLYSFNFTYWPELKDFVVALQEYDKARLVPREGLTIKIYQDGVLFKSLRPQDATPTSFSAYGDYGVDLDLRDYYYILPKRELSIKEVFIHSLDSAEGRTQRLFCILFYLKNKDNLKDVEHPMMADIKAVLQGQKIKGYPSLEDIEDRSEMYGIEL
jgi:DNA-binding transcriptional ArsR family regulator